MTDSQDSNEVVRRARDYYDSADADTFYYRVWGGEDIHIGLYESNEDGDIFAASRRSVAAMAEKLAPRGRGLRVLDIGAGYGGSGRYLAKALGHHVTCLNLSRVQNERNREITNAQGLGDLVDVIDGNFEELPFDDSSFEIVFCQDSILHSGNRFRVFEEVDRVLTPGGEFLFSDPMQEPEADPEKLRPVLERIHLASMGSIDEYRDYASRLGWSEIEIDERPGQLVHHYGAVLRNLEARTGELAGSISEEYLANMKRGLRHWIDAASAGLLDWGFLHFRKAGRPS